MCFCLDGACSVRAGPLAPALFLLLADGVALTAETPVSLLENEASGPEAAAQAPSP